MEQDNMENNSPLSYSMADFVSVIENNPSMRILWRDLWRGVFPSPEDAAKLTEYNRISSTLSQEAIKGAWKIDNFKNIVTAVKDGRSVSCVSRCPFRVGGGEERRNEKTQQVPGTLPIIKMEALVCPPAPLNSGGAEKVLPSQWTMLICIVDRSNNLPTNASIFIELHSLSVFYEIERSRSNHFEPHVYVSRFKCFDILKEEPLIDMLRFKPDLLVDLTLQDYQINLFDQLDLDNFLSSQVVNYDEIKCTVSLSMTVFYEVPATSTSVHGGSSTGIFYCSEEAALRDYRSLLNDKATADMRVRVGDEVFYCHKPILKARSQVFRTMLDNEMKESIEGIVEVEDISTEAMRHFLTFIYSGGFDNHPESGKSWSELLPELVYAADKYCVESLKTFCDNNLALSVTSLDTALSLGQLAERHGLKKANKNIRELLPEFCRIEKNVFHDQSLLSQSWNYVCWGMQQVD